MQFRVLSVHKDARLRTSLSRERWMENEWLIIHTVAYPTTPIWIELHHLVMNLYCDSPGRTPVAIGN